MATRSRRHWVIVVSREHARRGVTVVGQVTGDEPEPSDVIAGGFCRAAKLCEIGPLALERIRGHLPVSKLRYGFFELGAEDARAILALAAPKPH